MKSAYKDLPRDQKRWSLCTDGAYIQVVFRGGLTAFSVSLGAADRRAKYSSYLENRALSYFMPASPVTLTDSIATGM